MVRTEHPLSTPVTTSQDAPLTLVPGDVAVSSEEGDEDVEVDHIRRRATPEDIRRAAQSLDWMDWCNRRGVRATGIKPHNNGLVVWRRNDSVTPAGRRYCYVAYWRTLDGRVVTSVCPEDALPSAWVRSLHLEISFERDLDACPF